MSTGLLVFAAILIFLLVVTATTTAIYYRQYEFCRIYPSPWCWDDWKCMDGSSPADGLKNINQNCVPDSSGAPPATCGCGWDWYEPTGSSPNMCVN